MADNAFLFQIPNKPLLISNIKNATITAFFISMEIRGFEPLTSSLQSWRSSQLSYIP